MKFDSLTEAIAAASYVEQLHNAEQHWLMNRVAWLFVSQAFCLAAYVDLITSNVSLPDVASKILTLKYGLPIVGVVCCAAVGISVLAAQRVAQELANQRAEICAVINQMTGTVIPKIGGVVEKRDPSIQWTLRWGALPHYLPWVMLLLWFFLFLRLDL